MILTVLKNIGQVFCRLSLSCNLSEAFLMINLGYWFWEEDDKKYSAIPTTWHQGCMLWTSRVTTDINLHHLAKVVFVSFSTIRLLPHHLSMLYPLEGSYYAQCILNAGIYVRPPWGQSSYINIILGFCIGGLRVHSHEAHHDTAASLEIQSLCFSQLLASHLFSLTLTVLGLYL